MKYKHLILSLSLIMLGPLAHAEEIGSVDTVFKMIGPDHKIGVAAKTRNRAVAARRATGIGCARTLGRRRQTACYVRAIRRFILTPHRICG